MFGSTPVFFFSDVTEETFHKSVREIFFAPCYSTVGRLLVRVDYGMLKDQTKWNSMSLVNTAKAGIFAADRAIRDYANTIWLAKPVETKAETKKK